jgi:hypothetical protein
MSWRAEELKKTKYGFVDKLLSCSTTERQCTYKFECVETNFIQAAWILNTVIKNYNFFNIYS